MTLILSGQDTLESRRAQLTERLPAQCAVPPVRSILLALSAAGRTRLLSATLSPLNTSQPQLINFGILLYPIACDITISLGL